MLDHACLFPQPANHPASAVPVMGGSVLTVLSPWSSIKDSVSLAVPGATSSPPRGCVLVSLQFKLSIILPPTLKPLKERPKNHLYSF